MSAPRKTDRRIVARAVSMYMSGLTTRQVGETLGRDATTVGRWLRQEGVIRPRGVRPLPLAAREIVRQREVECASTRTIARNFAVSQTAIRHAYDRATSSDPDNWRVRKPG